ncbi:DUF3035 domain-containing protein [Sulfitobacter sp. S0837]|uniref:DUF3035 domain-containing protein n=1 Tax=Sulfitobacter maritimus TaxID=2741719 RepID=UPI001582192C|nr:DUF3035 domain-containing protein [Sulfitobacter maritimus]NUH65387.1 DUF3035 domain-containing protein [Sulfitobacter maritimus]
MRRIALITLIPLALAACSNQGLRDIRSTSSGPDEFMIKPVKPLEQPDSFSSLPTPTPGQANLTDRSAVAEGVAAFGGRLDTSSGIPASDAALVQQASRHGVQPGIRGTLAQADAEFRQRKGRFTQFRIVPVDRYDQAYKRQKLDAHAEAERWRKAGARTPSYPPQDTRFR